MAVDHYRGGAHEKRVSPGRDTPPITPNNTTLLNPVPKALRVFNTSDDTKQISFKTPLGGSTVRVWKVSPGETYILCTATVVMQTGTDVADLVIHSIIE